MKDNDVNVNELGTEYRSLGAAIAKELQTAFDEYGIDLPFQWKWIDTVLLTFAEEFSINGSQEYLLYAKGPDFSTIDDFGHEIPINLSSFTLNLLADKSKPAGFDNVTNKNNSCC